MLIADQSEIIVDCTYTWYRSGQSQVVPLCLSYMFIWLLHADTDNTFWPHPCRYWQNTRSPQEMVDGHHHLHTAAQRVHKDILAKDLEVARYSIRTLLSPSCIKLQCLVLQCSPAMQNKSQLGKVSEPQEHSERLTLRIQLSFCVLSQSWSVRCQAPGCCTATTKFTEDVHPLHDRTDPTGGEEYLSLPDHASASFPGKTVCPEGCSDALIWEQELKFLFQT